MKPYVAYKVMGTKLFIWFEGLEQPVRNLYVQQLKRRFPNHQWDWEERGWEFNSEDMLNVAQFAYELFGSTSFVLDSYVPTS